ncbi:50S ribosomal protein L7ae-like protein [Brevibacillus sp. SYP-B805]|uniref:50S ribosomal protein L7ae-like protein n=1 Tax=Brevibacillus sp. SYP-B805 TaxID=1578199 RepID=UPI0013EC315E|nr:50S ribosomal protein L7ae-like protein [Brevibacillus sp. SYP-B805]NGQ97176.1 50S ribosomal protein L7ae-like protein [Brevibacillus sp. SYP-B805]
MSYEKVERAKELTIGINQTMKAIESNLVQEVFIAEDADKRLTNKIALLCKEKGVPVIYVDSMRRLGKACGIDVGAAAAAIKKSG